MSLQGFEIGAQLGQGGVGTVWGGVHRASGVPVAIKTLTTRTRASEISLNRELSALARLNHVRVLHLYDHGVAQPHDPLPEGTAWLALEYASGGTLNDWEPVSWPEARQRILDVLDGLSHAHARGLVHRDLKPENLLLCTAVDLRPGLKIADFGLAWATDRDRRGIRRGGTPDYISPEQVRGSVFELGPWTDLYALGGMIWRWVTGAPPFGWGEVDELLDAHLNRALPDLEPRFEVPRELESLLRRLLAKPVADRPSAAAWVAREITGLGDSAEAPGLLPAGARERARTSSPLPSSRPPSRPTAPPTQRLPVPSSWHESEPARASVISGVGMGLMRLRDLRLVGRTRDRDAAWTALREVAALGRPRVIALTGPVNVGTSRLARWLVERSRELGVAEGYVAGADSGLSGLVERAFHLVAARGELDIPDTLSAVERALIDERDAPTPQRVFDWLVERAQRGPIVVHVDDPGDSPELQELLSTALFAEASSPLLFVATGRDSDSVWEELGYLPGFSRRELEPLDETAMIDVAVEDLGLGRSLAVALVAECGGQPGLLVAWVETLADRGHLVSTDGGFVLADGERLVPPADGDLETRVRIAMEGLPARDRIAVCVGAVLGVEVALDEWEAVLRVLEVRMHESAVRPLARAGLVSRAVDSWRFVDARVRLELLRVLDDAGELEGLHLAAAAGLARLPETPIRHARRGLHLLEAGHPAPAKRLLFRALEALTEAREWRWVHRVTERLQKGVDLAEADLDLQYAVLFHGTHALRLLVSSSDAVSSAERALELVDRLDEPRAQAVLRIAAEVFLTADRYERCEAVLARVDSVHAKMQRVRGLLAMHQGDLASAEQFFESAFATAKTDHMKSVAANGLGMLMAGQERLEDASVWFRICADLVEATQAFAPVANLVLLSIRQRAFGEAAELARRGLKLAEQAQGVRVRSSMMLVAALAAVGTRDQALLRLTRDRAMFVLRTWDLSYQRIIARCLEVLDTVADAEGRDFIEVVRPHCQGPSDLRA